MKIEDEQQVPWCRRRVMGALMRLIRQSLKGAQAALLSILLVIGFCLPAWGAGICDNSLVMDGCFEEEVDPYSPSWIQYSENFGSPLCDTELCGSDFVPRSWAWGVWFGGTGELIPEEASIVQSITIPDGEIVPLQFYLWTQEAGVTKEQDYISVSVGCTIQSDINIPDYGSILTEGIRLFFTNASNTDYHTDYRLGVPVTLNLSAYADGNPHNLCFKSIINSTTSFFIDDVSRPDKKFVNISKIVNFADDLLQPLIDKTLPSQEIRGQVFDSKEDILVNLHSSSATLNIRGGFGFDFSSNAGNARSSVRSLDVWSGIVSLQNVTVTSPSSIKSLVIKPGGKVIAQNLVLKGNL